MRCCVILWDRALTDVYNLEIAMGTILWLLLLSKSNQKVDICLVVMYIYIIMGRVIDDQMHRTQLFIQKNVHDFLQTKADEEGITISEAVRRILTDYFHRTHRKQTELGIQSLLTMGEGGE